MTGRLFRSKTSATGTLVAYSSGQAIGGKMTFANAGNLYGDGMLGPILVAINTAAAADMDLMLYDSDFTAVADHATFAEQAADIDKSIGIVTLVAADFRLVGTNAYRATLLDYPLIYNTGGVSGGSLYGQLVARAALTLTTAIAYVSLGVLRES